MKKGKLILWLTSALLILGMLLVSCGGNDNDVTLDLDVDNESEDNGSEDNGSEDNGSEDNDDPEPELEVEGYTQNQSDGGTSDNNSVDKEGIAGLPAADFSGDVESFTEAGVSIHYPQGVTAGADSYGGVSVTLPDDCLVTAIMEPQMFTFEEQYKSSERYLHYKGAELYNSTYNGYECIVFINDMDEEHKVNASIVIYVYIEDEKQVRINGRRWSGTLEEMMQNQDFLAVMQNVSW